MQWSSLAVTVALIVIILVVSIFGGFAGFSVNGVPVAEGGSIGIDSIQFMFAMTTFSIDGMPIFISAIFLLMELIAVILIVRLIRGVS